MSNVDRAGIAAKHLVGNLWYNLEAVPLVAGRLSPTTVMEATSGPAALAYSEMCRLMRDADGLSAGRLETSLSRVGFDFGWIQAVQADITHDGIEKLYGYAEEIQNAADLVKLRRDCIQAAQATNEDTARADTIKAKLLSEMVDDGGQAGGVRHVREIASELREEIQRLRFGGQEWGESTGFRSLDRVFRLVDGEMITIGGRPSQGKTSLVRQILYNRAKAIVDRGEDGQVLLFSHDDTARQVLRGLACTVAQVDNKRLRRREATDEEWEKFGRALEAIEALPLYIDDTSGLTAEDMHYRTAMLHAQSPVRLIASDYLELIHHPGFGANDHLGRNRENARATKALGRSFRCPTISVSQLTKQVEERADKWPVASDLKYAGEEESNIILLLNRPEHYISRGQHIACSAEDVDGIVLVNVAKNKEGDVGRVRMAFRKEYSRCYDLDYRNLNEWGQA